MSREPDPSPPPRDASPDADELRAEVDRLRLANQRLVAEMEEARHPTRALAWHGRRLWHAAWQRYYVARWHLLHARDPRKGLRPRDGHEPYAVRMRHPPLAERPRVLHVIGNFHTGGSARLVVDLVERLGHRYEQRVLVRSLPPAPAYTNVDLIHRERLTSPRAVARLLRDVRPQLVHVHMLGHQHDEYGRRDWSWYHQVFRAVEAHGVPCIQNLNIPVEPYVSPAVRCYVHVSDDVKARFGRRGSWNETIHPGSDLELFSRPPDTPVPDDRIGMVYRLQPDKLDERAIEPFIQAVRRRPATRVTIVGGGQFLDHYVRRVAAEGVADAFTFTGYVPYVDLPAHIARMSLFVAPVHTESFGQVSPFAMGMGLPVVGYDVGALREITGAPELLAPPGDADALAAIIVDLLDDRARRLRIGERNRARAQSRFSVQAMIGRYEALYEEVLAAPDAPRRIASPGAAPPTPAPGRSAEAPPVTVLMAVRDGERYLRAAIESVLGQTFGGFELLVVDDASTDRTREIIASYDDPRIRVLVNERHEGLSRSLNRGLRAARGRYVARLDADDVAEPDRLAAQLHFLERRPDVALVGSWYSIIDERGRVTGRRVVPCDHDEIRWMLRFCSAFAHSAVMIRRAALDDVGLYDESLVYAMDYDLWLRIAARWRVGNLDRFLVRWRTSPTSLTATLGDGTERLARVADDLAGRLGWPAHERAENERRADVLAGIVAGSPADVPLEEAEWAVSTLLALHDDFCRELDDRSLPEPFLRRSARRGIARSLLWMGHRYPDRRDRRYALGALRLARRVDPGAPSSRPGVALLLKLLGGRPAVWLVRAAAARRG